jgi:hypothetical protein
MKLMQKWLLGLALTGLLAGIFLTLCRAEFPDVLAIVLPLGASFAGLFLITFIFRDETAKFDAEERLRIEAARSHRTAEPEKPINTNEERHLAAERTERKDGSLERGWGGSIHTLTQRH